MMEAISTSPTAALKAFFDWYLLHIKVGEVDRRGPNGLSLFGLATDRIEWSNEMDTTNLEESMTGLHGYEPSDSLMDRRLNRMFVLGLQTKGKD